MLLLSFADFFLKIIHKNTFSFKASNDLDLDRDGTDNLSPGLGLNFLQRLSVDDKSRR